MREIQIDPPIVVSEKPGAGFSLSTVEQATSTPQRWIV
jgi:hypothetical protein